MLEKINEIKETLQWFALNISDGCECPDRCKEALDKMDAILNIINVTNSSRQDDCQIAMKCIEDILWEDGFNYEDNF